MMNIKHLMARDNGKEGLSTTHVALIVSLLMLVVLGLLLIMVIAVGIFIYIRRRRQRQHSVAPPEAVQVTPLVLPPRRQYAQINSGNWNQYRKLCAVAAVFEAAEAV